MSELDALLREMAKTSAKRRALLDAHGGKVCNANILELTRLHVEESVAQGARLDTLLPPLKPPERNFPESF